MRHPTHPWQTSATQTNRHRARMGSALALAAMLLAGLTGCGTPSAQQIYDSSTNA
jgi:hypothetical protein